MEIKEERTEQSGIPTEEELIAQRGDHYKAIVDSNLKADITHVTIESQASKDHETLKRIVGAYGKAPTLGPTDDFAHWKNGSEDVIKSEVSGALRSIWPHGHSIGTMWVDEKPFINELGVNTFLLPIQKPEIPSSTHEAIILIRS